VTMGGYLFGASPASYSSVPAAFRACVEAHAAAHPLTVDQIATLPISKVAGAHLGIPPPPAVRRPQFSPEKGLVDSMPSAERRIFCNRSLNMSSIQAVGFDMDYTLAQYKPETFECLAHELTKKNLVHAMGYPECVLGFNFDWKYMQKGLTIDKVRGNVLKRDRHHYVKVAYHGFAPLSKEQRHELYAQTLRDSFENSDNYTMIDTLFSLAEVRGPPAPPAAGTPTGAAPHARPWPRATPAAHAPALPPPRRRRTCSCSWWS